ncbi:MAG: DUF6179 domain-containing protein [Candidatus Metalachnospira sp.]|nr:DUF6179 domain-containing protein [Candidatus Metalachnospira sp.]
MNEIYRVTSIDRSMLDEQNYFDSLIGTAFEKELVNEGFIDRAQQELMNLLALRCRKYTSGESSSVPVETAESIMQSVNFTLGMCLKKIPEPEDALYELEKKGIGQCYSDGMKLIKSAVKSTRLLYERVKKSMVNTDNYAYNSTLIGGIQGFFKLYDAEYSAHEINITADYPVCIYPVRYEGIEFIREYLKNVWCENKFCNSFSNNDIQRVLSFHAIDYNDKVKNMVFNIYEVVLSQAIACAIANEDILSLKISDEGKKTVNKLLAQAENGVYECNVVPYAEQVLKVIKADKEVKAYTLSLCNSIIKTILFISEI